MINFMSSVLAPVLDTGVSGHSKRGLAAIKSRMSPPAQASSPIPILPCNHSPGVTSPQGQYPLAEPEIPHWSCFSSQASSRKSLWFWPTRIW